MNSIKDPNVILASDLVAERSTMKKKIRLGWRREWRRYAKIIAAMVRKIVDMGRMFIPSIARLRQPSKGQNIENTLVGYSGNHFLPL